MKILMIYSYQLSNLSYSKVASSQLFRNLMLKALHFFYEHLAFNCTTARNQMTYSCDLNRANLQN